MNASSLITLSDTFVDDSEGNCPLEIVKWFNSLPDSGVHRMISTKAIELCGIDFIDLDWTKALGDALTGMNQ